MENSLYIPVFHELSIHKLRGEIMGEIGSNLVVNVRNEKVRQKSSNARDFHMSLMLLHLLKFLM